MANEKKVFFDCEVCEKTFTNKDNGEVFDYYDLKLNINDNQIRVVVRSEDKSLFKYLVKDYFN